MSPWFGSYFSDLSIFFLSVSYTFFAISSTALTVVFSSAKWFFWSRAISRSLPSPTCSLYVTKLRWMLKFLAISLVNYSQNCSKFCSKVGSKFGSFWAKKWALVFINYVYRFSFSELGCWSAIKRHVASCESSNEVFNCGRHDSFILRQSVCRHRDIA